MVLLREVLTMEDCVSEEVLSHSCVVDEPTATRPLCFRPHGQYAMFFTHDGNKNVSDLITVGPFNTVVAHYDYAPFGAVTLQSGNWAAANPLRFSSEFHDDTLGLVYYNYRHYNPTDARWLGRDPIEEYDGINLYLMIYNNSIFNVDFLGMFTTAYTCRPLLWDYMFKIRMGSSNEAVASFEEVVKETVKSLIIKGLENRSQVLDLKLELAKKVESAWKKGLSLGEMLAIFIWSSGPYIQSWDMDVSVRFFISMGEKLCYTKDEIYKKGNPTLFCHIFNAEELNIFFTNVAEATRDIINDIKRKQKSYSTEMEHVFL